VRRQKLVRSFCTIRAASAGAAVGWHFLHASSVVSRVNRRSVCHLHLAKEIFMTKLLSSLILVAAAVTTAPVLASNTAAAPAAKGSEPAKAAKAAEPAKAASGAKTEAKKEEKK
jgi:hypothetical protein